MFVGFSFPPGGASTGPAALASERDLESRILKFCRHSSDAHRSAVGVDDLELEGTVHLVTFLCAVCLSLGRALPGDGRGCKTRSISAASRPMRSRQPGAAGRGARVPTNGRASLRSRHLGGRRGLVGLAGLLWLRLVLCSRAARVLPSRKSKEVMIPRERTGGLDFGPTVEVVVARDPGSDEGCFLKPSEVARDPELGQGQSQLISQKFVDGLNECIAHWSKDELDAKSLVRMFVCFALGPWCAGGVLAGRGSGAGGSRLSPLHRQ